MWPYIITFISSTIIFKAGDYVKKRQRIYTDFFAILLLCLLAGCRSSLIGTDTRGYLRPIIELSRRSTGFIDFLNSWFPKYAWRSYYVKEFEIGFDLIIYIFQKITNSVVVIQTVIQLLIVLPVYYVLKKREEIPIWLGMIVFDCLFYNPSLNMIRQSIAMSFDFLAFQFWDESRKKYFIIYSIIAFLFHKSSVIIIPIIVLYEFVKKKRNKPLKILMFRIQPDNINFYISILSGVIFVVVANSLFLFFDKIGFSYYLGYVTGKIIFMPNQILIRLPGVFLILYNFKRFAQNNKNPKFYLLMTIYEMIIGQFTSVNELSGRISQYFAIFNIISYASCTSNSKKKIISTALLILFISFYWWFYFCYRNTNETIPYISMFN